MIEMKFKKQIPNILTFIRLLLIPVFVVVFFKVNSIWALGIFTLACITDLADGYLARKWDAISDFGKLADPFADKVMQLSAIVCLTIVGYLPLWCVIVLAAKELFLIIGGALIYKRFRHAVFSDKLGKIAALIINLSVGLAFLHQWVAPWDNYLLYAGIALTLAAMVNYTYIAFKWMKNNS